MDWQRPEFVIALGAVIIVGLVAGRLRRETPATVAMNIGGYVLFLVGLGFAADLGTEALLAAGAASLGSLLFTTAALRRQHATVMDA